MTTGNRAAIWPSRTTPRSGGWSWLASPVDTKEERAVVQRGQGALKEKGLCTARGSSRRWNDSAPVGAPQRKMA
jgi:hypothetical protein